MHWSDHDSNFKAFNSQLLRECAALDWTAQGGSALSYGAMGQEHVLSVEEMDLVESQDVMAVTARDSGKRLRDLAPAPQPAVPLPVRPAVTAGRAALDRFEAQPPAAEPPVLPKPAATAADADLAAASTPASEIIRSSGSLDVAIKQHFASDSLMSPTADEPGAGHYDPVTADKEEAMRRLGSTTDTPDASTSAQPQKVTQRADVSHPADVRVESKATGATRGVQSLDMQRGTSTPADAPAVAAAMQQAVEEPRTAVGFDHPAAAAADQSRDAAPAAMVDAAASAAELLERSNQLVTDADQAAQLLGLPHDDASVSKYVQITKALQGLSQVRGRFEVADHAVDCHPLRASFMLSTCCSF